MKKIKERLKEYKDKKVSEFKSKIRGSAPSESGRELWIRSNPGLPISRFRHWED